MESNVSYSNLMIIISLYLLYASAIAQRNETTNMKAAMEFMRKADSKLNTLATNFAYGSWVWKVNLTDSNLKTKETLSKKVSKFVRELYGSAKKFKWESFAKRNTTLYRWFQLAAKGQRESKSSDLHCRESDKKRKNLNQQKEGNKTDESPYSKMTEIYGKVRICPPGQSTGKCNVASDDISKVFGTSRDPKELKHYWLEFRRLTGEKYRDLFMQAIKNDNAGAVKFGFKNKASSNIAEYEDKEFVQNVADELEKILPLYKQIHAYVRKKLKEYYKSESIQKDGPIPAHLLGDPYAQQWIAISDIVKPYPNSSGVPNVTKVMLKKQMKQIDMVVLAERFFKSIGMKKMTPHFWHYSLIKKPDGLNVSCHASAHDFSDGKDYRIKMCAKVDAGDLSVVHHEMGHIEYYMYYSHLPYLLRGSANPGFHEAIGDAISLSALTPSYFSQIGLLNENETSKSKECTINYLMTMALRYAVTVPYAYIIDFWRNQVYEGKIKESELNKKYWQYRLKYQGVCPPEKRTEKHFDIGAKYHIASGVEYFRYYVAEILQFQIHKVLCKKAKHKGPLHECNIYKKKQAGKAFAKLLSAGKSKNWKRLLSSFSGGEFTKLDASALLEYFKPLMDWLQKQNANEYKGWKSTDPMVCPGDESSGVTGTGTQGTTRTTGFTSTRGLIRTRAATTSTKSTSSA